MARLVAVTGGLGALGQATARAFALAGAEVAVIDRRPPSDAAAAVGALPGPARYVMADLSRQDDTERAIAEAGPVDWLVNIAGGYDGGASVWETDVARLDQQIALNVRTAFLMCRAALPGMVARGHGRIVNISSRAAVQPGAGQAPYNLSKLAVISLTESVAEETREHGVTCNAILPSVIDTPANRASMSRADFSRWVPPQSIAEVCVWLCSSDAAGAISGAAIPVYGRA